MDRQLYVIADFDEQQFSDFAAQVGEMGVHAATLWSGWEARMMSMEKMYLLEDPSTNLPAFWAQLEEVQRKKNDVVDIITAALFEKARWESKVASGANYVRHVRAKLVSDATVKAMKNKDMQEARMHDLRPDIFDMYEYCVQMLTVLKTIIQGFDKQLDLLDSANLNINRQIVVTELLTYKGLL
jgi:hypothetical protein